MDTLSAILIDDEPDALVVLENKLTKLCPEVKVISKCDSAIEGLKQVKRTQPDILFLDVQMPHFTGFEVLEMLGDINFAVVFVTAHDEFAARAFKLSAVHYLVKPVIGEDLVEAVNRAKDKMAQGEPGLSKNQIEALQLNVNPNTVDSKVAIPGSNGFKLVNIKDIIYLEGNGDYTNFYLTQNKVLKTVKGALGEWQENLEHTSILRVHNSKAVNLNHIEEYVRSGGGYVVLSNQVQVNVSKKYKANFLDRIQHPR